MGACTTARCYAVEQLFRPDNRRRATGTLAQPQLAGIAAHVRLASPTGDNKVAEPAAGEIKGVGHAGSVARRSAGGYHAVVLCRRVPMLHHQGEPYVLPRQYLVLRS